MRLLLHKGNCQAVSNKNNTKYSWRKKIKLPTLLLLEKKNKTPYTFTIGEKKITPPIGKSSENSTARRATLAHAHVRASVANQYHIMETAPTRLVRCRLFRKLAAWLSRWFLGWLSTLSRSRLRSSRFQTWSALAKEFQSEDLVCSKPAPPQKIRQTRLSTTPP